MKISSRLIMCSVGVLALTVIGCSPATVNSNGDSGSLVTTLAKLTDPADNIGALNSAELQILVTELPTLIERLPQLAAALPEGISLPTLTDAEAEALEQFLDDNGVNTYEDLADLAEAVAAGDVEVPAILLDAFEAFAAQFGRPRPD